MNAEFRKRLKRALLNIGFLIEGEAKKIVPVRTGNLQNSIRFDTDSVNNNRIVINVHAEYAPHVEFGTEKQRPKPYMRPAVYNSENEITEIIKNEMR